MAKENHFNKMSLRNTQLFTSPDSCLKKDFQITVASGVGYLIFRSFHFDVRKKKYLHVIRYVLT